MIQDATKHSRIFDLLVVPKHVSPLPSNFEASNRYLKKMEVQKSQAEGTRRVAFQKQERIRVELSLVEHKSPGNDHISP